MHAVIDRKIAPKRYSNDKSYPSKRVHYGAVDLHAHSDLVSYPLSVKKSKAHFRPHSGTRELRRGECKWTQVEVTILVREERMISDPV